MNDRVAGLSIEAHGLRKSYGEVVAVDGLDLEVAAGQIVGLVGPDGAGKTTAMRLLCGVLAADGGTAMVAGCDALRAPESVKSRIGYLPQRFALHRDLTVAENVRYFADLYGVPHAVWRQRSDEMLEVTDLARFRRRLAGRLSGGMRQKLALVCALLHRPQVVFLDEPTTGVDPVSRRDFWKILYNLPRDGVSVLISTPYMDEAARCHRVGFMDRGRLLAYDTPAALREAVEQRILEVRCRPQRDAREALKALAEVAGVEVFGDRLHVALRPGARAEAVREGLAGAGLRCESLEETEASLEDVFVALSSRHGEGTGA